MRETFIYLTNKAMGSELISGSFYIFLGTTVGNILAFLFNLFLVRHVSFAVYGEFSALISLITLSAIPAQAFLPTIVQFAGKYFATKNNTEASYFYQQLMMKIGLGALLLFFAFMVFSPFLASFLHIKNISEIILVGAVVASIYIGITNTAFLQSLLHFKFLSFTTVLGGILKLFLGIVIISLGFGLGGLMWAYFLTYFFPFLLTFLPLRFLYISHAKRSGTIAKKEIISYAIPAALAIFSLSSFTSTDILLVKHFFPATEAGYYSGLSLIGRIIFYFSAPISTVMFPLVVKRYHQGIKPNSILYLSFLLVLIPSLCLTLFYFLFPKISISIFLGKNYFPIAGYVGWFGLYLSIFSLLNVLINFFLSIRKTNVSIIIAIGALLQIIGITFFHSSLTSVVVISLLLSFVLFAILLLYYFQLHEASKKST